MATIATETRSLLFLDSLATIRESRLDGEGGVSVIEMTAPHGALPPRHAHREEERVHLLEGEVTFYIGDDITTAKAGDTLVIPEGVPHMYLVQSKSGARWLNITASGCFEGFVRAVGRPAEEGEVPSSPSRLTLADAVAFTKAAADHGIELLGPARVLSLAA